MIPNKVRIVPGHPDIPGRSLNISMTTHFELATNMSQLPTLLTLLKELLNAILCIGQQRDLQRGPVSQGYLCSVFPQLAPLSLQMFQAYPPDSQGSSVSASYRI